MDAVVEAENKKAHHHKGDCRMVGATEEDLAEEVMKLHENLAKNKDELKNVQQKPRKFNNNRKSTRNNGCYNCEEKGHFVQTCLKKKENGQGNEFQRLD